MRLHLALLSILATLDGVVMDIIQEAQHMPKESQPSIQARDLRAKSTKTPSSPTRFTPRSPKSPKAPTVAPSTISLTELLNPTTGTLTVCIDAATLQLSVVPTGTECPMGTLTVPLQTVAATGVALGDTSTTLEAPATPTDTTIPAGAVQTSACPAGQIVVGFDSRSTNPGGGGNDRMTELTPNCADFTVVTDILGNPALSVDTDGASDGPVTIDTGGGPSTDSVDCPDGQIVVGITDIERRNSAANEVLNFALVCLNPSTSITSTVGEVGRGTGNDIGEVLCPDGSVVTGVSGDGKADGTPGIAVLSVICTPLELTF